jgi:hypothetical protein
MNDSPQSQRWCAAGYSIINSGSNLECTAMPQELICLRSSLSAAHIG